MRKLLLVFCCLPLLHTLHAQLLYGTTYGGGWGTICKLEPATNTLSAAYNLDGRNGARPNGSLMQATNGKLYGMTESGGNANYGVLYSFDAVTGTYTKLLDFDLTNSGRYPYGGLMQATNGKLYGLVNTGGSTGNGVIFSFDPATNTYTKLKDFGFNEYGSSPYGNFVQASDGKLYALAKFGGNSNAGVIFSYDITTNTYTKLYDFSSANGTNPEGSLVQASNGKLYGMTLVGGNNNYGVIFSFDPATNTFTKLKDLDGANGSYPRGSLIQAGNGKLYGMTSAGGAYNLGVIFSFDAATNTFVKLKIFDGTNGGNPWGSLVQATDGKLYGMTYSGGAYNKGVAFSYDINTAAYTRLADFNETNGGNPTFTAFIDLQPYIKINKVRVAEGNSGQTSMTFKVTLSNKPVKTVKVNYKTVNKTATAPADYVAQSGTLTFAAGVKTKKINILINGDTQVEGDEKFNVVLSNPVNAIIQTGTGVGTILNDDAAVTATAKTTADNNRLSFSIAVSPNPANSMVQVRLHGYSGNVKLQLMSMDGIVMQEKKLQTDKLKMIQQHFDVSGVANGTYLLVAMDENGNKQSKQIVVAH